jgi:hypothetical protein
MIDLQRRIATIIDDDEYCGMESCPRCGPRIREVNDLLADVLIEVALDTNWGDGSPQVIYQKIKELGGWERYEAEFEKREETL